MNIKENKEKKLALKDYAHGIKLIWQQITVNHKREVRTLVILSFFIAILDGIIPLISGHFFDALTNIGADINGVWIALVLLLVTTAFSGIGQKIKQTKSDWLQNNLVAEFFPRIDSKILRLPMSYLKNNPMSDMMQKMSNVNGNIQDMFSNVFIELLPAFLSIIVAFTTVFTINTNLALILLAGVLIYIFIILRTISNGAEFQRENKKQWMLAFRSRADGMYNIPTVKQFAAEEFEIEKNKFNFGVKALRAQRKTWELWSKINLSQKIIVLMTQAVILILSINLLRAGNMTAGQVIAFNAYVGMVFNPFLRLGNMWRTIQNSIINVSDLNEILSLEPENYDEPGAIKKQISGDVEFKSITFFHDERRLVLDNLSFSAPAGSIVAFVGKTGSGKTSLTELIYRFHDPKTGEILVDGIPINKYDLTSLRSQIGIVPQEPVLFDTSIRENIMYPRKDVNQKVLNDAAKKADLFEFIKDQPDGWETIVGDRGVKLSGGQRQRIAIARALVANPKILILDESTSALDAETQRTIETSLKELMKGKTTFIVAHRLSAVRNADKICVLHKGKIVEEGTHDELIQIANGRYKKLYDLQFKEEEILIAEHELED